MIGRHDLINLLTRFRQGNGSWTLHAGAAVVYYLNHRSLDEIDLYANRQVSRAQLIADAEQLISKFIPTARICEVRQLFKDSLSGTVKIAFERIVVSFVLTPSCRTIVRRFSYNGHLFVASLFDSVGAKMLGIHNRDKRTDYIDIAATIKHGFSASDLITALRAITPHDIDIPMVFNKMRSVPLSIKEALTAEELALLDKTANAGLVHIKAR